MNTNILHLYRRAGFGLTPLEYERLEKKSLLENVNFLIEEGKKNTPLKFDLAIQMELEKGKKFDYVTANKKMNLVWLDKMVDSECVLSEKLTLFFHGHFACRRVLTADKLELNNIIRRHSLGRFSDMLREVSKSPAMIIFLNNKQNIKGHPNENFAREVMELFSMGQDVVYTEKDIQEGARAFTGWSTNQSGKFIFNTEVHDFGPKTFLGKTGNWNGDDAIDIILSKKETAYHLTRKILEYFVELEPKTERIIEFGNIFFNSNYDLAVLMKEIFTSKYFYTTEIHGALFKSPIELMVNIKKLIRIKRRKEKATWVLQRRLNQTLFYPPNVAGWPNGEMWIDNGSLMIRINLAMMLITEENKNLEKLEELLNQDPFILETQGKQIFPARLNEEQKWREVWLKDPHCVEQFLLPVPTKIDLMPGNYTLSQYILSVMGLPEFQLS